MSSTGSTPPHSVLPALFHRLVWAWAASLTADGMRFAAVPLLAFATDRSPGAVSAVAAAMALPWLLVSLPAGAVVDRRDPARVIAAANVARALTSVALVAAILAGRVSIPLLCVVGFVLTAAETFADSAAQSLLVRIVPQESLERANARFVSSENVGLDLVGPLLSGALFRWQHWLPFAGSGLIFLVTAVTVLGLSGHREDGSESGAGSDGVPGGVVARSSFADGFRVIFSDTGLRSLVITVAVMVAAIAAMEAVLVVYSGTTLHLSEALYPTLLAGYSVGLLVSTAAVGRLARRFSAGSLMLVAIAGFGGTLVLLGTTSVPAVAWVSFALMGASGGVWNVLSATRRQRRTPPAMMARVSSTFRALTWGALPIGAALGGLAGEHWGVPAVFVVAGGVVLVLGVLMSRSLVRPDGQPVAADETAEATESGPAPAGSTTATAPEPSHLLGRDAIDPNPEKFDSRVHPAP